MERRLSPWRVAVNSAAALIFLFLVMPSVITAVIAFGDSDQIMFPPHGYSLHLFRQFFGDPAWLSPTFLSIRIAVISTLISLLFGVPAAYALVRGTFPGRRFLSLFLLSPIMVPHIAIALGLYIYFIRIGVSNGDVRLIFAHVIASLPFVVVTTGAGVGHIDPALEKAATVMGASPLTVLFKVTVPLLAPSIAASGLFAFLISFDEVVISWFVSRAGQTTLPVKMFASIQFEVSPILAAISTMLTVVSVLVCLVVAAMQRKSPNA